MLLVLKEHLIRHVAEINEGRVRFPRAKPLRFRREDGQWYNSGTHGTRQPAPVRLCDYLSRATDWQIFFDLPGSDASTYRVFPPEIAATSKRPDVLLISRRNRWAICLELTCPKEERIQAAHDLKLERYADLTPAARSQNWLLTTWPIEVGCRGFVALSTLKAIRAFRFTRSKQTEIKCQLECVARRCTYYIWCCREQSTWDANHPMLAANETV